MSYWEKIIKLYGVSETTQNGYEENELQELEQRLNILLPKVLRSYYLSLGKNEKINLSHNRLLGPNSEVFITDDGYLVIYEENQGVVYWGIKQTDLSLDNPPVYGNYNSSGETQDWHLETDTTEDFILLMAIYNGTLGGLKYNANSFDTIPVETVNFIKEKYSVIKEISFERQKIYTDDFNLVISISIDENQNGSGIFIGTENKNIFDSLLDTLSVNWSYISEE